MIVSSERPDVDIYEQNPRTEACIGCNSRCMLWLNRSVRSHMCLAPRQWREGQCQNCNAWTRPDRGCELSTTAADWKAADPQLLATMLGELHLIRAFEETVLELAGRGPRARPGALQHRPGGRRGRLDRRPALDGCGQRLAPRPPPVPRQGPHPRDRAARSTSATLVTPELQAVLQRTLAEILGLAQGFCSGRGGSMHLQWFEAGALGTNAIVGGGVPLAAGNAWAQKHAGTDGPHRDLLRRRRGQHRLGARDP